MSPAWHVWTDGSCHVGVPEAPKGALGWGGWCAVIIPALAAERIEIHGRVERTTSVRMEIYAVIEGLRALPPGQRAVVHSDASIVVQVRKVMRRGELATYVGPDIELWRLLAAEMREREVVLHQVARTERGVHHKRAHAIAGAMARGENPPEQHQRRMDHRLARDKSKSKPFRKVHEALRHTAACEPGLCFYECPVRLAGEAEL